MTTIPKVEKRDLYPGDESDNADFFGPRPPPGYASLRAVSSQILLPLTVSNKCGQAFRWRCAKVWEPKNQGSSTQTWHEQLEWSLCLSDRVVLLRQDERRGFIYHRTLFPSSISDSDHENKAVTDKETERWLNDYLNLDVPLEALYVEWEANDPVFARFATRFTGLRMLRQDPWECLCAFVCSSNNNIARIGQMVQNLCTHFSSPLLEHVYSAPPQAFAKKEQGTEASSQEAEQGQVRIAYHPFPPPEALAKEGVEEKLRHLGFGYRAKYLAKTAQMLCENHGKRVGRTAEEMADHLDESHWLFGIKAQDNDKFPFAQHSNVQGSDVAAKMQEELSQVAPSKKRARKASSHICPNASMASTSTPPTSKLSTPETTTKSRTFPSVRSYLQHLRTVPYASARAELMQFPGVGPKVADCILLMSLDQASSIPVDRHVFQFAEKWYRLRTKKYEEIADYFRDLWGEYAGWAHSVLFTADLRSFANYNSAKKEEVAGEKAELSGANEEFWGNGAVPVKGEDLGYPTPPSIQSPVKIKNEEALLAVHSPPRVAIPELVPQSWKSEVKAEEDASATLAERIKSRPKRKSQLNSSS
ncbi:related to 8-oxoguanine DNA-glycosylase [Melanopsichium pennsylvanicum]|uniref:DNA-(apurinic or apyrimidinic site) lyase n=2 Tax=Melanopsichium pennsylvanicum TaxID=63383 RepID=A0AAJ4XID6_9BASI|nr:related to 8-oxoguanine DNA-glycosylase [Melanopsichium pennsylvanicum 4]SNX82690.1 related to 8-oxoguanine DNA-glycosylase [Melanopsichium pennsylvanicum]